MRALIALLTVFVCSTLYAQEPVGTRILTTVELKEVMEEIMPQVERKAMQVVRGYGPDFLQCRELGQGVEPKRKMKMSAEEREHYCKIINIDDPRILYQNNMCVILANLISDELNARDILNIASYDNGHFIVLTLTIDEDGNSQGQIIESVWRVFFKSALQKQGITDEIEIADEFDRLGVPRYMIMPIADVEKTIRASPLINGRELTALELKEMEECWGSKKFVEMEAAR